MISIKKLYEIYDKYPLISTDTRKIKPNSIFFCLKGENFNGNDFALKALTLGAAFVVTENENLKNITGIIVVDNTLATLQELAAYHRQKLNIPIIGITGTNGKTTTKELLTAILSKKYKVCSTKENLNNHIGVPLTILSISKNDEIAVVEMGANHVDEIAQLCKIALPNYAIITNIGRAHLEGFGSYENIINTKIALYKSVIKDEGSIFVCADDKLLVRYCNTANIITYGSSNDFFMYGEIISMNPYLILKLINMEVHTQLIGKYNFNNILAAACIGKYFDISIKDIAAAISNYSPSNNRSQLIVKKKCQIIADCYNANPDSMRQALINLSQIDNNNKFAILGDMLELGDYSYNEHLKIVNLAKELNIPVFFVGQKFKEANDSNSNSFNSIYELSKLIKQKNPFSGKLILIKGSRGMALEKIVQYIK